MYSIPIERDILIDAGNRCLEIAKTDPGRTGQQYLAAAAARDTIIARIRAGYPEQYQTADESASKVYGNVKRKAKRDKELAEMIADREP